MSVLSPRFAALAVASAFSLVLACTGSTTITGFSSDSDAGPIGSHPSDGSAGSSGSSGSSGGPTSCADPTCPLEICSCNDSSFAGTSGVCRAGGECDVSGACSKACGSVGYGNSAYEYPACSSDIDCTVSQGNVSCSCNVGFGYDAYPTCKSGHCSGAPEDVCPAACKNDSGWAGCSSAADCAPIICACKDGTNPATASPCSGSGTCSTSSAQCPGLCASRGGWSGSGTTTNPDDGGTTGPKPPGASCSKGSECTPFDCSCKNGSVFKGNAACESGLCGTQAQVCNLTCLSSGGWSGS